MRWQSVPGGLSMFEARRQALANGTANREAAMLNANSAAFPATFHFTEDLGWIPQGWEVLDS